MAMYFSYRYAVLPCAISQRIVVMAAKSAEVGHFIRAKNADSKYIESHINIVRRLNDFHEGVFVLCWSDYLLCGYYAATTLAKRVGVIDSLEDTINDIYLYVDGNIPSGSGLSSSSAMVVASALAILSLWGMKLPMEDIAQSCIDAERLIGTMGGGMDQTISCLAIPGKALLIKPGEQVKQVTLPDNVVLVLADSMIRSEKGAGSKLAFNTRVVECKLASIILAALLGCTNLKKIRHINDLELTFREKHAVSKDSCCLEQLIDLARTGLKEECYTIAQIEKVICDVSGSVFCAESYFCDSVPSLDVLRSVSSFKIKQRCIHVLTEALRVKTFTEICSSTHPDTRCLGQVLNESHRSLRDLYECSCAEVDRLQIFSLDCGRCFYINVQ
jgi:N-acetylgalactosamine kinase